MPKMRHQSGGRSIEVSPEHVGMYESQGWQVVTAAKKTATKKSASPADDEPATADEGEE